MGLFRKRSEPGDYVDLVSAIEVLRNQLEEARSAAVGKETVFGVGPVEVEFAVELRSQSGGNTGANLWFMAVGANGQRSSAATQKVKFTLNPKRHTGEEIKISSTVSSIPDE
ncbi:trypco2 family protein [Nocardia fluminea]|uniref:trypco2 family protein n=1 Tax=Nocardia fluminea TaxID=134984 RepID=UPI003D121E9C